MKGLATSSRMQMTTRHLEITGHIQFSNMGFPDLYQHIHLHQQTTDAINLKITSLLLLAANDKIVDNFKETFLQQQLYLVCILVKTDEPRTCRVLRPYARESS